MISFDRPDWVSKKFRSTYIAHSQVFNSTRIDCGSAAIKVARIARDQSHVSCVISTKETVDTILEEEERALKMIMDNLETENVLARELANIGDDFNRKYYSKEKRKKKGKLVICLVVSAAVGIICYSFVCK